MHWRWTISIVTVCKDTAPNNPPWNDPMQWEVVRRVYTRESKMYKCSVYGSMMGAMVLSAAVAPAPAQAVNPVL